MPSKQKSDCPLCRLYENEEIRTKFYYEDEQVICVDCNSCNVPMVVFKQHEEVTKEVKAKAIEKALKMFPNKRIDLTQRTLQHPHFHLRK